MIQINNTYYELELIDIIQELKNQLALEQIYLFNQIKETSTNLMVSCPFHKEGQERRPSCGIRKEDGYLHCFTCGESCSLEQLISRCFGKNDLGQYGLDWLKNNFLGDIISQRDIYIDTDRNPVKTNSHIKFIDDIELDKYRFYHPYMYKRKMNNEVIDIFDVGYDKESNCITFPVRDIDGNCLFIARRNVDIKFFNYPAQIEKPVYGIYELKKYGKDVNEVIICESMINAITCWVYDKYAVALNGTGTPYQYKQLLELPYRKYVLALDPDEAGDKGREKLRKALGSKKLIREYIIPKGKDINDLTKEEFEKLVEVF